MNNNDQLFELVKSLKKPEKRYFKIYSGKHDCHYLKLFAAIDSMKIYDEKELRNKNSDEVFVNNLAYNKNYLYNLILDAMRALYADSSSVNLIINNLSKVNFLNKKGLYHQSNRILDKALKAAEKIEHHELMLILYLQRLNNIISMGRPVNQDVMTDKIFEEQTKLLELIGNKYEYNILHREFFILFKRLGAARSIIDANKFDKIMQHPLFKDEDKALSFDAKIKHYHDNVLYYYQKGDLRKAFSIAVKYQQYTESKPMLIKENYLHAVVALDNVLTLSRLMRNSGTFENALKKLKMLPLDDFRQINLLYEEFQWCVDCLELERAEDSLKNLSDNYYKHKHTIDNIDPYFWGYVCFTSAKLYIILEKYEKSLQWVNHIRNLNENQIDVLNSVLSKILNLIIHLELKNYDVLESQIKSTYRFLLKSKRVNKFEEIFLTYLKKQLKVKSQKETIEIFELFINDLMILKNDKYEERVFKSFDLISWLESKIKRKPFIEILKSKVSSAS